jgi:hypothetical protein
MAYFIQVTRAVAGDPPALVNLDNVFAITQAGDRGARFHSVASDTKGSSVTFTVRESLAELMAQIPPEMKEEED